MRSPQAVAVSTYFWVRTHADQERIQGHPALNQTLDESMLEILASVCRWTTVRHIIFSGFLSESSTVFWYEDAKADPLEWHYRWTHMAGLRLPTSWVEDIAGLSGKGAWSAMTMGVNPHPGGRNASVDRTWKDEVSPEIWDDMDDVLRRWLPPALLARFGVPPFPPEH